MTTKPNKHGKKRVLCNFWSWRASLIWRILPFDTNIKDQHYRNQLSELKMIHQLRMKLGHFARPMVIHQDKALTRRTYLTRFHITETRRWKVLPMPPYSTYIALSDYNLFCSLKNFLRVGASRMSIRSRLQYRCTSSQRRPQIFMNEVLESSQSAGNL